MPDVADKIESNWSEIGTTAGIALVVAVAVVVAALWYQTRQSTNPSAEK